MRGNLAIFLIAIMILGVPLTTAISNERPLVVTSIAPLASIVQDAFGNSVDVVYLIPLGADPHEYQLTATQLEILERADVIVTTGGHLPVEKKIAELVKEGTIRGRILLINDYKDEGFRYLPEHWYNNKDNPHGVWLDPTNALAIAKATELALEDTDPINADVYRRDYENFRIRVETIVQAYHLLVGEGKTAVIEMPSNQYAIEWLGIKAIASIKPEEEVPAKGVDELVAMAKEVDVIVYGKESPDQLKEAAFELSSKSGKPLAEITVFWKDRPYTEVLAENSANVIRALRGEGKIETVTKREDVGRYVAVSLLVGLVLGTSIGVLLRK